MKENSGYVHSALLLAAFLAGTALAGCGNSNEKSTKPATATAAVAVGMSACTTCHSELTSDWLAGKHANLENNDLYSPGNPTNAQVAAGSCAQCHDPLGESRYLISGLTGNVSRPVIGCEACHGPGSLHANAGDSGGISRLSGTFVSTTIGATAVSGQYALCVSCHELLDSSGTGTAAPTHDLASATAPTGTQYVITDTHFATAGTYSDAIGNNSRTVSGYAMDFSSPSVCTNCHDPHGTADVARDWAQSLHADKTSDHAWALYNWTCDGTSATSCGTSTDLGTGTALPSNRWICQRCHTTTGFAAHMEALASGDTVAADRLLMGTASPMTFTQAWKPEQLQCKGCHTIVTGAILNPGAYTAAYLYWATFSRASVTNTFDPVGNPPVMQVYARSSFQFPDLGTSNICVPCHSGRNNGAAVHNLNAGGATTIDFSNLRFGDAHRFTSAGTMFRTIGYEYSGRSYENPSSYKHDKVGTSAVPNTGTGGPCVGCHMYRASGGSNHLLAAVSKTASAITNVSSEVCFVCHANTSTTLAKAADDERLAYGFAKNAFNDYLGPQLATGVTTTFATTTTNWLTPGDTDTTGNITGRNNLGALFNSRYLSSERGAYIHNSKYVKRLIYDSIDWLDDNQMNYTVGSSLTSACTPSPPPSWCTGAKTYLLPNGVRTGASAERPY